MYHIFDASIGNYKLYWWSTPYTASKMVADIINSLEKCVSIPFRWFVDNFMKINSDKSLYSSAERQFKLSINGDIISNNEIENYLAVKIST